MTAGYGKKSDLCQFITKEKTTLYFFTIKS